MEKPNKNSSPFIHLKCAQVVLVGLGLLSGFIYFFNFRLQRFFTQFEAISKTGIHFYVFLFLLLSVLYFISIYLVFKQRALWVLSVPSI